MQCVEIKWSRRRDATSIRTRTSKVDRRPYPPHRGVWHRFARRFGGTPFGLPDVLKIRLERPAGIELRRVANLEKRLEVAVARDVVTPIEATHAIGYAGIRKTGSKSV